MKALVIYDMTGYIWNIIYGIEKEPAGLMCMWVDIPDGAQITSIDVSDPSNHKPVFTYNDNSDIKKLYDQLEEVKEALNPTFDLANASLEETKEYMLKKFSEACTATIYKGQEVQTSVGKYQFSFNHNDQINLKEVFDLAFMTGMKMPYHADGINCTMWDAIDIVRIYGANAYAKTYQTTYCNLLNNICRNAQSKDEVMNMTYGMELPESQKEIFDIIMEETNDVFSKVLADFWNRFPNESA